MIPNYACLVLHLAASEIRFNDGREGGERRCGFGVHEGLNDERTSIRR